MCNGGVFPCLCRTSINDLATWLKLAIVGCQCIQCIKVMNFRRTVDTRKKKFSCTLVLSVKISVKRFNTGRGGTDVCATGKHIRSAIEHLRPSRESNWRVHGAKALEIHCLQSTRYEKREGSLFLKIVGNERKHIVYKGKYNSKQYRFLLKTAPLRNIYPLGT